MKPGIARFDKCPRFRCRPMSPDSIRDSAGRISSKSTSWSCFAQVNQGNDRKVLTSPANSMRFLQAPSAAFESALAAESGWAGRRASGRWTGATVVDFGARHTRPHYRKPRLCYRRLDEDEQPELARKPSPEGGALSSPRAVTFTLRLPTRWVPACPSQEVARPPGWPAVWQGFREISDSWSTMHLTATAQCNEGHGDG